MSSGAPAQGPERVRRERVRRAAPWTALAVAVLVLLVIEVITRASIVDRATAPTPNERDALLGALGAMKVEPVAVFLGSSHTQADIAARRIEEALGAPRGSVLNAGLSNAGPRDMLRIYEQNRALLGKARVVYIDVGPPYLNSNSLNRRRVPAPAWRRRATLEDRLAFPADLETRVDLLVGWAWRTWDQRTTWRNELRRVGLRALGRGRSRSAERLYDELGRPGMGPERVRMTPEIMAREIADTAERHMFRYRPDEESLRSLEALLTAVGKAGGRPVLIELPVPSGYRARLEQEHLAAVQRWQRARARRLAGLEVVTFPAVEAELEAEDFRDADHLSARGASRLAPVLAADLAKRLGAEQAATGR